MWICVTPASHSRVVDSLTQIFSYMCRFSGPDCAHKLAGCQDSVKDVSV